MKREVGNKVEEAEGQIVAEECKLLVLVHLSRIVASFHLEAYASPKAFVKVQQIAILE